MLPFLFGERFVARYDLKEDRATGVLRVHAVHWEPGAPDEGRPVLDAELTAMVCMG